MAKGRSKLKCKGARPWAPRPQIAPETCRDGNDLVVASNGSAGCYGGWEVLHSAPKEGEWVRMRVKVRWCDLERGYDCVNVAITWLDEKENMAGWEPILPLKFDGRHVIYEGQTRVCERAKTLAARLLMACSATGQIRWSVPVIERIPAPKPRKLRLGAAGAPLPAGKKTIKKNTQFYLQLCREAAQQKIDLLCLPEIMLQWGMPTNNETLAGLAFKVPGKEIVPFQDFARQNKMALCFSVLEKNKELVHNTAILIDKQGELVGKYRKVHLAQPLEIWWGVTPGNDFPVYELGRDCANAKVSMNICMDSSALESVRVPARKGAEIICLPIMGDHRASTRWYGGTHDFDIDRWQNIQRVRAMDSHVHMVISRNSGYGTGVFSPRGETLAISGGKRVVFADVDLADLPRTGHDSTFKSVCWYERREPTYAPLSGGLLPDPFA
ncbi:MAG: carbon-nitrogen hydrolase family protein [Planctomycetes bacterium]|nr:carbon-nitrogen hydrolase family protein [Planctomycetota bacterium]